MITVNDRVITEEEVAREVQYHAAESLDEARRQAAVALVVRELLLQRAEALGIAVDGEEERPADEVVIERLLEKDIDVPVADDETCRRYFEANSERFRSPDVFEASHILFPACPEESERRAQARTAAESTLEELRVRPDSFQKLARERSGDSSTASDGGHLGQITKGQTTPEFEACLHRLAPGQIYEKPLATRYGYHIIRLDRESLGRPLTYPMAKRQIEQYLSASTWQQAVRQYIRILAGQARVTGIDIEAATTPLIQ